MMSSDLGQLYRTLFGEFISDDEGMMNMLLALSSINTKSRVTLSKTSNKHERYVDLRTSLPLFQNNATDFSPSQY